MAIRITFHTGRKGKNGIYLAKHLDSPEGNAGKNYEILWKSQIYENENPGMAFEDVEQEFYERHFKKAIDAQNKKYEARRQFKRVRKVEDYRKNENTCPDETLYYLGAKDDNTDPEIMLDIFKDYMDWRAEAFPQVVNLCAAMHKEEGAYHIHFRDAYIAHDKDGNEIEDGKHAFKEMGIERPKPDEKEDKNNCAKITYTDICRHKLQEIAMEHGIEIITEPRPKGAGGLTREQYIYYDNERKEYEKTIREKDEEIAELKKSVKQKDEKISSLTEELKAKNEEIKQLNDFMEIPPIVDVDITDEEEEEEDEEAENIPDAIRSIDPEEFEERMKERGYAPRSPQKPPEAPETAETVQSTPEQPKTPQNASKRHSEAGRYVTMAEFLKEFNDSPETPQKPPEAPETPEAVQSTPKPSETPQKPPEAPESDIMRQLRESIEKTDRNEAERQKQEQAESDFFPRRRY